MKEAKTIRSLFSKAGFVAEAKLGGVAGDRYARVIRLKRQKKPANVLNADIVVPVGMTSTCIGREIFRLENGGYISNLRDGGFIVRGAAPCM